MLHKGLASIQILGEIQNCQVTEISPGLPGHRPAFKAGFVFLGLEKLHVAAARE
jgi:hypothetical protein